MNRRTRGFTLIELIVVVGLISVLLTIAVPSFASFISNYRATGAVNEIMQGMTLARGEALKRGRKVTMLPNLPDAARTPSISGSWVNGWTVFVDLNGNQTLDSTDTVIFKHPDLPTSIVTQDANGNPSPFTGANYVIFDGTGYPRTTGNTTLTGGIRVTDRIGNNTSNVRTLCLAMYGRPRIVKGIDACTSG